MSRIQRRGKKVEFPFDINNINLIKRFEEKNNLVTFGLLISEVELLVGYQNGEVKIFSIKTGKCTFTFKAGKSSILDCFLLSSQQFLLITTLEELKIFSKKEKSFSCEKSIQLFYTRKESINLYTKKVIEINKKICVFQQYSLEIYNTNLPFNLISTFGMNFIVLCLVELKNHNYFVSGGADGMLLFWDKETFSCSHFVKEVQCTSAYSLIEKDNILIIGGNAINVLNLLSFQIEIIIDLNLLTFDKVYSMFNLDTNSIIVSISDGTFFHINCKEWNILREINYFIRKNEVFIPASEKTIFFYTQGMINLFKF